MILKSPVEPEFSIFAVSFDCRINIFGDQSVSSRAHKYRLQCTCMCGIVLVIVMELVILYKHSGILVRVERLDQEQ